MNYMNTAWQPTTSSLTRGNKHERRFHNEQIFWLIVYPGLIRVMLDFIIQSFHDLVRNTKVSETFRVYF